MNRFDVEADRITTEWQHETGEYSISDWSCGELNKLIASALRAEAERVRKEGQDGPVR